MANTTIRTDVAAQAITAKLAGGFSVSAACRAAKISRSAYYDWYEHDPDFAARVNDAIEDGTDKLEDSAARQAMQGNSALMTLLLKSRRPEKYRERQSIDLSVDLRKKAEALAEEIGVSVDELVTRAQLVAASGVT